MNQKSSKLASLAGCLHFFKRWINRCWDDFSCFYLPSHTCLVTPFCHCKSNFIFCNFYLHFQSISPANERLGVCVATRHAINTWIPWMIYPTRFLRTPYQSNYYASTTTLWMLVCKSASASTLIQQHWAHMLRGPAIHVVIHSSAAAQIAWIDRVGSAERKHVVRILSMNECMYVHCSYVNTHIVHSRHLWN